MELRQLEYLVAVAEEGNFTRASERIHVAQPAVSAQIQRLERELGQPLLDRSRRAVRLTAAGEAVLPHARAALAAVRTMGVAADEVTRLVRRPWCGRRPGRPARGAAPWASPRTRSPGWCATP